MKYALLVLFFASQSFAQTSATYDVGNNLSQSFVGDAGVGGHNGLVPAAPAGSAANNQFLNANGSFTTPDLSKPRFSSMNILSQTPNPVPPGFTPNTTSAKFQNVSVLGNYAYVASGGSNSSGVQGISLAIYNIQNQNQPTAVGLMQTASVFSPGFLNGAYNTFPAVIANSSYLFVCSSGSSYVYAINVSNPSVPTQTSALLIPNAPGSIYGCAYYNGYLYAATQNKGLDVVDFGGGACGGTLTARVQCFQEGGAVKSFGVTIANIGGAEYVFTTQYVTSVFATRQIKAWSIATPQTPSLLQSFQVTTVGEILGITVSGNTAFVSVVNGAVYTIDLIDVTTPSNMANLSQIAPSYALNSATVAVAQGNYLFVPSGSNATNGNAIDVFNISNLSSPYKVYTTYSGVANAVVGGIALDQKGYLYVADYGATGGTISTLDVYSTPLNSFNYSTITDLLQLSVQTAGNTPSCAATNKGGIAFTSAMILCGCNGASWVKTSDGSTACTF